jgi:hypothetical protein
MRANGNHPKLAADVRFTRERAGREGCWDLGQPRGGEG